MGASTDTTPIYWGKNLDKVGCATSQRVENDASTRDGGVRHSLLVAGERDGLSRLLLFADLEGPVLRNVTPRGKVADGCH